MTRLTLIFCLSLAVAAAADLGTDKISVFGSLRPEAIATTPEGGDLLRRMDDGYSRVGLTGVSDLNDSWQGFFRYERRVSANDGESDGAARSDRNELRQVHVGARGPYGSLSIGRHYGLYYDYIDDELDRHRSHYSDAIVFGDLFVSNAVVWRSPDLAAGNIGILVEFNDADTSGSAIDERIEVAGTLHLGAGELHAGFVQSPTHDGLFGLALSHPIGPMSITGVAQRFSVADRDRTLLSGALDVRLRDDRTARLALTQLRTNSSATGDDLYALFGVDQQLSADLLIFAELFVRSTDTSNDETALITGLRFDF